MNSKILKKIETRLDVGAEKYGAELDVNDGRIWTKEALEEVLDACVYIAAKILQIENAKSGVPLEPEEVEMLVAALDEYASTLYISGNNEKHKDYCDLTQRIKEAGKME